MPFPCRVRRRTVGGRLLLRRQCADKAGRAACAGASAAKPQPATIPGLRRGTLVALELGPGTGYCMGSKSLAARRSRERRRVRARCALPEVGASCSSASFGFVRGSHAVFAEGCASAEGMRRSRSPYFSFAHHPRKHPRSPRKLLEPILARL